MAEQNSTVEKIDPKWIEVVDDCINVPDELIPLFNSVGTQIRFFALCDKEEVTTVAHIVEKSRQFFSKNKELLD